MVNFRLLGAIDLTSAEARAAQAVLKQPKHVAILAYLALATPRGFHRRDKLLSLFWPDLDESHARGALNQALYRLRQALGEEYLTTRGAEEVGLNWDRWWCDAIELRAAAASQRHQDVLELYEGELLSGFYANASPEFEQWLDGERDSARDAASSAALQLAGAAITTNDEVAAIEWLRKALSIKPFDESILQRLMDLLQRNGEGQAALLEYDRFAARLAADLEVEPSLQTVEMARRIRNDADVSLSSPRLAVQAKQSQSEAGTITRRRERVAGIAAAALLLALLVGTFAIRLSRTRADSSSMTRNIVMADFVNRTPDKNLAAGITEALNIDLAQSQFIKVAAEPYIGGALKRMGADTVSVLTEELAREVALRDGLKAVLRGEVAAVGSGYVISTQLITADSGRVLLSVREKASSSQDVIAAVDRLSEHLRKRMGDSLRGARANQPLEAVTTRSLEALKLYSAGARAARRGSWGVGRRGGGILGRQGDEVVSLFEQAIALDSTFSSAYRGLAVYLYWRGGQQARVDKLLTRAYELRHQLTERERLVTEGTYFSFVTRETDRAIACFQQLLDRDPDDDTAIQHLAVLYMRRRDYERSAEMNERDWKIRGGEPPMSYLLALRGTGRIARSDSILRSLVARDSAGGVWHRLLIAIEAGHGNFVATDTLIDRMQRLAANGGPRLRSDAEQVAGLIKLWRGNYTEGSALIRAAARAGGPLADLLTEATLARYDVFVLLDADRAKRRLDAALASTPLQSIPAADRPYLEVAEAYAYAGEPARAAQLLREFGAVQPAALKAEPPPVKTYTVDALVKAANGAIARAREALKQGERDIGCWASSPWLDLARALVEESAGNADSTIAAWERIARPPTCALALWPEPRSLAQARAHERLAQLYDARGQTELAAAHYSRFIKLWPAPDPVLQPRWRAAKARLAELTGTSGRH